MTAFCLILASFPAISRAQEAAEFGASFTRADYLKFYTDGNGVVFTDWVDNPKSHMYWKEMTRIGMVTVRNEGRLRDGKSEYRKGFRNPERAGTVAPEVSWYCYTGLDQETFDSRSDELFLRGFFLISVQSFQDAEGESRYQALWVKPNGKTKAGTRAGRRLKEEVRKKFLREIRESHPIRPNMKPKKMENIDVPPGDPASPAAPSDDPEKG